MGSNWKEGRTEYAYSPFYKMPGDGRILDVRPSLFLPAALAISACSLPAASGGKLTSFCC